jgi:hypothetical protein
VAVRLCPGSPVRASSEPSVTSRLSIRGVLLDFLVGERKKPRAPEKRGPWSTQPPRLRPPWRRGDHSQSCHAGQGRPPAGPLTAVKDGVDFQRRDCRAFAASTTRGGRHSERRCRPLPRAWGRRCDPRGMGGVQPRWSPRLYLQVVGQANHLRRGTGRRLVQDDFLTGRAAKAGNRYPKGNATVADAVAPTEVVFPKARLPRQPFQGTAAGHVAPLRRAAADRAFRLRRTHVRCPSHNSSPFRCRRVQGVAALPLPCLPAVAGRPRRVSGGVGRLLLYTLASGAVLAPPAPAGTSRSLPQCHG